MKQPASIVRGFDLRIQRIGSNWMNEVIHAYAPLGSLPSEWSQICEDPTVLSAEIFLSSERRKQSQRRKLTASYTRCC